MITPHLIHISFIVFDVILVPEFKVHLVMTGESPVSEWLQSMGTSVYHSIDQIKEINLF